MSQQQRPLTEAEERLRHHQRTNPNQPLPRPRNQQQLDARNRDRLRDLTRNAFGLTGEDGIGTDPLQLGYNIITSAGDYITGQQTDLDENERRRIDRQIRNRSDRIWRYAIIRLAGRNEFNILEDLRLSNQSLERVYFHNYHLWTQYFLHLLETREITIYDELNRNERLVLEEYINNIMDELDRIRGIQPIIGGSAPRSHMAMQSEESRAISNYFHNKLRGGGNCLARLRRSHTQPQMPPEPPPVFVGMPVAVAPAMIGQPLVNAPPQVVMGTPVFADGLPGSSGDQPGQVILDEVNVVIDPVMRDALAYWDENMILTVREFKNNPRFKRLFDKYFDKWVEQCRSGKLPKKSAFRMIMQDLNDDIDKKYKKSSSSKE